MPISADRVENTTKPNPEKKFPLVRGEGLFQSSQNVMSDLLNLEGQGQRVSEVMANLELTDEEALDALDQLLWRASYTFSENRTGEGAEVSQRLFYVLSDLRWVIRPLRERLKNAAHTSDESVGE